MYLFDCRWRRLLICARFFRTLWTRRLLRVTRFNSYYDRNGCGWEVSSLARRILFSLTWIKRNRWIWRKIIEIIFLSIDSPSIRCAENHQRLKLNTFLVTCSIYVWRANERHWTIFRSEHRIRFYTLIYEFRESKRLCVRSIAINPRLSLYAWSISNALTSPLNLLLERKLGENTRRSGRDFTVCSSLFFRLRVHWSNACRLFLTTSSNLIIISFLVFFF